MHSTPGVWLLHILRVFLGVLFIYASLDKIWMPATFAEAIYNYRLVPDFLLHTVAILLPWLEFVAGVMLVFNIYPKSSSAIIGLLLIAFTLGIASAMARGLDFNCGCFNLSAESKNIGLGKLFENSGLILAAALVWYQALRISKDEPTPQA